MNVFDHPDFDHHESIHFAHDHDSGLCAIITIHDTTLGPSLGGCRMYPYATADDALKDVLRLSRGMTYKSAVAELPLGGGKSVIIGNPKSDKSDALFEALGRAIDGLGGRYIVAEDSGISVPDIRIMSRQTSHLAGLSTLGEHGGDPSPSTAYGVFRGIEAAVRWKMDTTLEGKSVAVQGVGNVGRHLCHLLTEAGARLFIADVDASSVEHVVRETGAEAVSVDDIMGLDVDVFSPCALGGAINADTLPKLRATIVAGAANNQLASPDMAVELTRRDILYAPDYVINAGGIIDCHYQLVGAQSMQIVYNHCDRIAVTLAQIFERARDEQKTTAELADQIALERLAAGTVDGKIKE